MSASSPRLQVLVAESDEGLAALIHSNLVATGYDVLQATDTTDVLTKSRELSPALLILDMMLAGMGGKEVLKSLKSTPATTRIPVVAISQHSEEIDRIVALELGADDYLAKPFSARELALRVRAILSRRPVPQPKATRMSVGELRLDTESRTVTVNGKPAELSALDFRLLAVLMGARGSVVSREKLIESAWGEESEISPRTVDTQFRRLRKKLGSASDYIQTVRGFGYRLDE